MEEGSTINFILNTVIPLISAVIVGIVGPLILYYIKFDSPHTFNFYLKEMKTADFIVSSLRNTIGSDRAFVLNYHNGGRFYSGQPRQKISMSYEKSVDQEKLLKDYQDVPISYFSIISFELYDRGEVKTKNVEEMIDSHYKDLMLERGVKAQYSVAIYKKAFSLFSMLKGKPFIKRMVASVHFWFRETKPQMTVKDNIIFDRQLEELKQILTS